LYLEPTKKHFQLIEDGHSSQSRISFLPRVAASELRFDRLGELTDLEHSISNLLLPSSMKEVNTVVQDGFPRRVGPKGDIVHLNGSDATVDRVFGRIELVFLTSLCLPRNATPHISHE